MTGQFVELLIVRLHSDKSHSCSVWKGTVSVRNVRESHTVNR